MSNTITRKINLNLFKTFLMKFCLLIIAELQRRILFTRHVPDVTLVHIILSYTVHHKTKGKELD